MKFRTGFVSNSSSSSFVVLKKHLTPDQIKFIKKTTETYAEAQEPWGWQIRETDDTLEGSTWMDNFDMKQFMYVIDVDMTKVTFTNCVAAWHVDRSAP